MTNKSDDIQAVEKQETLNIEAYIKAQTRS